jgi:hypothetical protein
MVEATGHAPSDVFDAHRAREAVLLSHPIDGVTHGGHRPQRRQLVAGRGVIGTTSGQPGTIFDST